MNAFAKMVLASFKPQLVNLDEGLIAALQAEKPALEAAATAEGANVEQIVLGAVIKAASAKFGWFALVLPDVQPQIEAALGALAANGVNEVGPMIDAACNFLKHEEAYL